MSCCGPKDLSAVPLFPLPNVVLLPRAVLPLHVFEQRYREMMRDALRGQRLIAMALLRPGWEKKYHTNAEIDPMVCVGHILTHEQLCDGRFNLIVQGVMRARVVRELQTDSLYRVAELKELECSCVEEIYLACQRGRLIELFSSTPLKETTAGEQFLRLVNSPMSTAELADVASFTFIDDVNVKQSILAETDTAKRVTRVIRLLESLRPMIVSKHQRENAPNN